MKSSTSPRSTTRGRRGSTWLHFVHHAPDAAVLAAYGWPADLFDAEILSQLLPLNLERAGTA